MTGVRGAFVPCEGKSFICEMSTVASSGCDRLHGAVSQRLLAPKEANKISRCGESGRVSALSKCLETVCHRVVCALQYFSLGLPCYNLRQRAAGYIKAMDGCRCDPYLSDVV